jgi:hypothetical protein
MEYVFFALVTAFAIFVARALAKEKPWIYNDFNDRFPPISDDEFVARCTPGTRRDTALRVRRIVAEQLGVEYARIYPSSRFVQDLNAD